MGVELIDSRSGQCRATNVWSDQETARLFVDPTGRSAFTFEHSGEAHLWTDGQKKASLLHYSHPLNDLRSAFFDPLGRWVCTTGKATKAAVFEVATGRLMFSLGQDVNGAAFSEDGGRLVTFGPDRLIRLWDVGQGRELRILRGHVSVPELSAFSGDGRFIVTASREGVVKLWTGWPGRDLVQAQGMPMIGPYTTDGRYWATSPNWNGTFVCEADTGQVAAEFPLQKAGVLSMAFSPDGRFLLTAGSEKVARIWDVPNQRLAALLRGHDHVIWAVAWSADGRWIATGDSGGVARIWDAATRRETWRIQTPSRALACVQIDPAGRKLLTVGYGLPRVWDIQTGRLLWELDDEQGGASWATFSPDGRKIICPCRDRLIRLWDAANGKLVERWTTRSQGWAICTFSPDSQRFVVPVVDFGTLGVAAPFVEIWDTQHGRHLLDLRGHTDSIYGAVFSPRGNRILTAAMDETVRQWETFPWKNADYREYPGATLAERIRRYAEHYWRNRVAVELAGTNLPSSCPIGSVNRPTPREWERVLRPARAPGTSSNLLNLDDFYTGTLDSVFRPEPDGYQGDDDLSQLPKGVITFHGIDFDIRGVILLRCGQQSPTFWFGWVDHPVRVDGIHVGTKIRHLHVLHATVGQATPSTALGSYMLHYSDGTAQEFDILYGRDLRDWWLGGRGDLAKEASQARVAWTGSNPLAEQCQAQVRLFLRTYENPRPDVEVVSIDFVSKEAIAAPFLVAMTVEP